MRADSTCLRFCLLGLQAAIGASRALAQIEVQRSEQVLQVFAGRTASKVPAIVRNRGEELQTAEVRLRVYQAAAGTAALVADVPWKKLPVLPGQSVLESAALSLPDVRAETRYVIQWLESTNKVIGITEILAYPPDLLKDLNPLLGAQPLGVFDPLNQLKPLLKAAAVECQDLEDTGLENCHGPLAVIGPFQTTQQMRESLERRSVKALAQKGVAVVWLQPPPEKIEQPRPTYYTVPQGTATVVVVQAELVANLAESPQAQLNLIRFARLALRPEPLGLPNLTLKQ